MPTDIYTESTNYSDLVKKYMQCQGNSQFLSICCEYDYGELKFNRSLAFQVLYDGQMVDINYLIDNDYDGYIYWYNNTIYTRILNPFCIVTSKVDDRTFVIDYDKLNIGYIVFTLNTDTNM